MTGNSPGNGSANGGGHKLLAIFGRYKPAPWRGHYSLSKLFFNFYLVAVSSFIIIALFADFVISMAIRGVTEDYMSRFMRGTIVLIEDELFRHPRVEWPTTIKSIDEKFAYRLEIVERWTLRLEAKQAERLDSGEMAVSPDGDILYHRLKETSQVLAVGPLSPRANAEYHGSLSLELRIRLLTWTVIGLVLAIAVWFFVRPFWRDLEAMRQTARALGEGQLDARAPLVRSSAFDLLAATFDGMAERIQRLIATQKELSSSISHELRTPIARLRFALEMISETEDGPERDRLRRMMEDDLDELDGLIDSSLTYARYEREPPALHLSPVEFAPWIEEEVESMRILGRNIELVVDTQALPPGLQVELDRKSMPYALTNLLRNAIKYANARIQVSAEVIGERVALHVDDDGPGIPKEERERVFSAFTRLDSSRDRATGGYGLGLAIARLVLEQHGGEASADEAPLGGARFTLTWPVVQSVTKS
ncbi:HAMP domain-containing protein [Rhodocyclus tenuis]|uniref:histidine kinase n=1 Tax=Rhodocyclus tenuis TaxID=1066 RepID=A0A6L5JXG0_RHOTE|nr:ATP-binding protein [Rhodocyclus gracilis]MQY51721.1 HAMP domain-containing protein [Rhodocyclus gracilis]MRD73201.1 HAMP domain-containing protein [Rhodocyclus gracilis]